VKQFISRLQPIGLALMLPIAVLPVAALLLRVGQPDLLNLPAVAAAGDAIFSNLGLLFAIGVAVGLARENHGAAGLAAVVGYLSWIASRICGWGSSPPSLEIWTNDRQRCPSGSSHCPCVPRAATGPRDDFISTKL